jgi:hypothetical protein
VSPGSADVRRDMLRTLIPGSRPTPAAEPVPEPVGDHPAVAHALALAGAVRTRDPDQVAPILAALSTPELADAALALAAMVPPGIDPADALAWLDLPARQWPDAVLAVEHQRWTAGARDATALDAHTEHTRRTPTTEGATT